MLIFFPFPTNSVSKKIFKMPKMVEKSRVGGGGTKMLLLGFFQELIISELMYLLPFVSIE